MKNFKIIKIICVVHISAKTSFNMNFLDSPNTHKKTAHGLEKCAKNKPSEALKKNKCGIFGPDMLLHFNHFKLFNGSFTLLQYIHIYIHNLL